MCSMTAKSRQSGKGFGRCSKAEVASTTAQRSQYAANEGVADVADHHRADLAPDTARNILDETLGCRLAVAPGSSLEAGLVCGFLGGLLLGGGGRCGIIPCFRLGAQLLIRRFTIFRRVVKAVDRALLDGEGAFGIGDGAHAARWRPDHGALDHGR